MTAQPTVISRRPTQAPSGLPGVPSAPWASAAAACLKGLPLHRQDAPRQHRLWLSKSSWHANSVDSTAACWLQVPPLPLSAPLSAELWLHNIIHQSQCEC